VLRLGTPAQVATATSAPTPKDATASDP
jgi:hypothetical protein